MNTFAQFFVVVAALLSIANAWVLTGAQGGVDTDTGSRPARQNIIDMYGKDGPEWDLYIQSLAMLYSTDQRELLSYFSFSGESKCFAPTLYFEVILGRSAGQGDLSGIGTRVLP